MKITRAATAITIVAALTAGTITACSSSTGRSGRSNSGSNSGSSGGDCGYSWNPCGNSAPSPKVDAEPRPNLPNHIIIGVGVYDCNLYLESVSGLIAGGGKVDADVFGYCTGTPPTGVTFKLSIWTFNVTHAIWFEAPESIKVIPGAPLQFPDTSHYTTFAYCVPGQYKIYMAMFHDGVKVIENFGPTIRFSQAQCAQR